MFRAVVFACARLRIIALVFSSVHPTPLRCVHTPTRTLTLPTVFSILLGPSFPEFGTFYVRPGECLQPPGAVGSGASPHPRSLLNGVHPHPFICSKQNNRAPPLISPRRHVYEPGR